jgi:small subunit ribosomal protein S8
MSLDPIANALTAIKNSETAAKKNCLLRPASRLLREILRVMQENGYIDGYEFVDDKREGEFRINLAGKLNECKAIKPRYAVQKNGFEKYEKRYLPSRDIGIMIVSTPQGVLSHKTAKQRGIGGRLIAFVY